CSVECEEEKCFVFSDRSVEADAVILQVLERLLRDKRVPGIEGAVLGIPPKRSVQLIGATPGYCRNGRHAAEFRSRCEDVRGEFLDRFHRWLRHRIRRAEIPEIRLDPVHARLNTVRPGTRRHPGCSGTNLYRPRN